VVTLTVQCGNGAFFELMGNFCAVWSHKGEAHPSDQTLTFLRTRRLFSSNRTRSAIFQMPPLARSDCWTPLALRPAPIPPLFPPVLLVYLPIPPLYPPVLPVPLGSVCPPVPLVSPLIPPRVLRCPWFLLGPTVASNSLVRPAARGLRPLRPSLLVF
jgi:hypothetical protein